MTNTSHAQTNVGTQGINHEAGSDSFDSSYDEESCECPQDEGAEFSDSVSGDSSKTSNSGSTFGLESPPMSGSEGKESPKSRKTSQDL